jgi:hypothetical protein
VGQDPDRVRPLAHDLGHPIDLQPGHHPQHDGLGLAGGQGGDQGERRPGRGVLQDGGGRVIGRRRFGHAALWQLLDGPASGPAPPVPGLVPGDGEHPGPERGLLAGEPVDRPDDGNPGLGCQVLGSPWSDQPEVAQQPGLQVVPEHPEGILVAAGGRPEHGWEGRADHRHRARQGST